MMALGAQVIVTPQTSLPILLKAITALPEESL